MYSPTGPAHFRVCFVFHTKEVVLNEENNVGNIHLLATNSLDQGPHPSPALVQLLFSINVRDGVASCTWARTKPKFYLTIVLRYINAEVFIGGLPNPIIEPCKTYLNAA